MSKKLLTIKIGLIILLVAVFFAPAAHKVLALEINKGGTNVVINPKANGTSGGSNPDFSYYTYSPGITPSDIPALQAQIKTTGDAFTVETDPNRKKQLGTDLFNLRLEELLQSQRQPNADGTYTDKGGKITQAQQQDLLNTKGVGQAMYGGNGTGAAGEVPNFCGVTEVACGFFRVVTVIIHNAVVPLFGLILRLVNILFNQVFDFSVRNFNQYGGSGAVKNGWTIARDLVNLSLIFVLLYAALGLILNLKGDHKRMVTNVIAVALLVNFSAFLTGVSIDASNILANQFYTMAGGNSNTSAGSAPDITTQIIGKSVTGLSNSKVQKMIESGTTDWWQVYSTIIIQDLLKIPFFLITAIVLGAGALMFFVRMITLIFLIMLSPLAFLAYAVSRGYWDKWLKSLSSNIIFAPAFFFMFAISVAVISKGPLANLGGQDASLDTGWVSNMVYAVMVNGMMVASLLIARVFGAYGANGAVGVLNRMKGGVGRTFIGKPASLLNRGLDRAKERMQESRSGRVALGTLRTLSFGAVGAAKETLEDVTKSKFGGAKYSQADIDNRGRQDIETGIRDRRDNPRRLAAYVLGLSERDQNHAYDKLSARDRVALETELTAAGGGAVATRLRATLSVEEREKVEKAEGDARRDRTNREGRNAVNALAELDIGPNARPIRDGVEMTADDMRRMVTIGLPEKQARRLSANARINPAIIPYLTVRHLNDLMAEGELTNDQIRAIRQYATPQQITWMDEPIRQTMWTV